MSNKLDIRFNMERILSPDETKEYLTARMMSEPINGEKESFAGIAASKMRQYSINGSLTERFNEVSEQVVNRLEGVEGNFDAFTIESLERMPMDYFEALVDASYSQNTMAPDVIAQAIGASENKNESVFTTAEMLETAEYVVNDYPEAIAYAYDKDEMSNAGLVRHVLDGRMIAVIYEDKQRLDALYDEHANELPSLSDAIQDLSDDGQITL